MADNDDGTVQMLADDGVLDERGDLVIAIMRTGRHGEDIVQGLNSGRVRGLKLYSCDPSMPSNGLDSILTGLLQELEKKPSLGASLRRVEIECENTSDDTKKLRLSVASLGQVLEWFTKKGQRLSVALFNFEIAGTQRSIDVFADILMRHCPTRFDCLSLQAQGGRSLQSLVDVVKVADSVILGCFYLNSSALEQEAITAFQHVGKHHVYRKLDLSCFDSELHRAVIPVLAQNCRETLKHFCFVAVNYDQAGAILEELEHCRALEKIKFRFFGVDRDPYLEAALLQRLANITRRNRNLTRIEVPFYDKAMSREVLLEV